MLPGESCQWFARKVDLKSINLYLVKRFYEVVVDVKIKQCRNLTLKFSILDSGVGRPSQSCENFGNNIYYYFYATINLSL